MAASASTPNADDERFPFDLLGSASFLVEDRLATVAALVDALGFPEPKPHWHMDGSAFGMTATFLRPIHDTALCPTPIEIVQLNDPVPNAPAEQLQTHIGAISASQGARPVKVHATDLACGDADEMAARFSRLGVTHWVHRSVDGVPHVWVGVDPDDRTAYDASFDANLYFEVLPTAVLGLPPAAFAPPRFDPGALAPGTMIRVVWRTYLVSDLDATLDVVYRLLGWRSERAIEVGGNGAPPGEAGFPIA